MPSHFHQPEYSPCTRAVAMLLVALLLVAPAFHVCGLGGRHCDSPNGAFSCHNPLVEAGYDVASAVPAPFSGTCLARLLMAMPAGLPAPAVLVLPAARRSTLPAFAPLTPPALFLPRPPARGPPRLVI